MQKTILTLLGSALIAATAVQTASAAERHRVHRTAPAQISEPIRNANDSWQPLQTGPDWSRYQNGAYSAPAGR